MHYAAYSGLLCPLRYLKHVYRISGKVFLVARKQLLCVQAKNEIS